MLVAAEPGEDVLRPRLAARRAPRRRRGRPHDPRAPRCSARARELMVAVPDVAGFGWETIHAAEGDGPPSPLAVEPGIMANDHLRVAVDTTDGTITLTTTDGVSVTDANRLVESGDGGDTYNYSPPTEDSVVDAPEFVQVAHVRVGPGAVAAARRLRCTAGPRPRSATPRRARRRADETVLTEVRTTYELRSARAVRARPCRARPPRPRPPAARPLPASRAGRPAPTPSARSRWCTAALSAEGGPHEHGTADVRVTTLRRLLRRRDRPRGAPRRAARVRGGRQGPRARAHAAAGHRVPLTVRAGAAAQSRPGRSSRSRARSSRSRSRSSTRSSPTAATGTPPTSTRQPTSSSSRSSTRTTGEGGDTAQRSGSGAAGRGRGRVGRAARSRRRRRAAASTRRAA